MTSATKLNGAPLRLQRTEQVEELLQLIWEFRPELHRKNTITLILGLRAFLEDCQLKALNSPTTSAIAHPITKIDVVAETGVAIAAEADVEKSAVAAEKTTAISDDIEW